MCSILYRVYLSKFSTHVHLIVIDLTQTVRDFVKPWVVLFFTAKLVAEEVRICWEILHAYTRRRELHKERSCVKTQQKICLISA